MTSSLSGINIQWPISEKIIDGFKTIETRTYPLNEKHINKPLLLIETPGKKGRFKARATGIIIFTNVIKYRSKKDFYEDYDRHLVDPLSDWAWKDKEKYGWEVEVIEKFQSPIDINFQKGIVFTNNIILDRGLQQIHLHS